MDLEVGNGVEKFNWGKSLPVPSIQEIVKKDLQAVPDRYVHENKDRPNISQNLSDAHEIPVIDFSALAKGDEDESRKLHLACKDWGFFQLVNHGVKEEVLEKMKSSVSSFFELPVEEKIKYAKSEHEIQGYGQNFVVSENQKLDWSDMIYLITVPEESRKYKFWALTLPGFKEALEEYSIAMHHVANELQSQLSVLLGLEPEGLKTLQGDLKQGIRMNYYPICARPDLVLGISPHSDGTAFTLLLQDDDVTGLQIKHNNAWIPVKPIPNALVVNIGDATEIQSNGMYKSIEHRGVTNEIKPRISVATFMFPDDEQEIGPLETMIDDQDNPRRYRNIKYGDYVREKFSRKMQGKDHTQFVKIHK